MPKHSGRFFSFFLLPFCLPNKNPQLVAQHCFVANLGSTFRIFHLAWSTCRGTTGWRKLLRKVERGSNLSNRFWLCRSFFIKLTTCNATNLLVLKQINQSAYCISSTHNKRFCCETSWSRKVKYAKHRPKSCNETMLRDKFRVLYLVFRLL